MFSLYNYANDDRLVLSVLMLCCGFEVCRPLFMLLGILNSLGDVQNYLPCGSIIVSSFRTFKVLQRDFESLDCGKTNLVPIPWFHKNFWRAIHHEVQKSIKNQLWIINETHMRSQCLLIRDQHRPSLVSDTGQ